MSNSESEEEFCDTSEINPTQVCMVNALKFQTFFLSVLSKILVIRAGIHKMLVRIANREDPDQTAFS